PSQASAVHLHYHLSLHDALPIYTTQIEKEEDLFPVPVQFYNNGQLFQASKIGDNIPSEVITSDLTEEQLKNALQLFCDITHEYNTYKEVGEGWQACDFMLFLYESPW